jgi:hypothetical protein
LRLSQKKKSLSSSGSPWGDRRGKHTLAKGQDSDPEFVDFRRPKFAKIFTRSERQVVRTLDMILGVV